MKIFFDMDDTLANFSKGIEVICGMEVPPPPQSNDAENTDDAAKAAARSADDAMWDAIRAAGNFYRKLEPVSGMQELFMELFRKYGRETVQILTAIPKEKRNIKTAKVDKEEWAYEYLDPAVIVNAVMREDKIKSCKGRDSFLIDDLASNIKDWESFGGTGILFKGAAETRTALEELGIL